jgi:hypothetical protein
MTTNLSSEMERKHSSPSCFNGAAGVVERGLNTGQGFLNRSALRVAALLSLNGGLAVLFTVLAFGGLTSSAALAEERQLKVCDSFDEITGRSIPCQIPGSWELGNASAQFIFGTWNSQWLGNDGKSAAPVSYFGRGVTPVEGYLEVKDSLYPMFVDGNGAVTFFVAVPGRVGEFDSEFKEIKGDRRTLVRVDGGYLLNDSDNGGKRFSAKFGDRFFPTEESNSKGEIVVTRKFENGIIKSAKAVNGQEITYHADDRGLIVSVKQSGSSDIELKYDHDRHLVAAVSGGKELWGATYKDGYLSEVRSGAKLFMYSFEEGRIKGVGDGERTSIYTYLQDAVVIKVQGAGQPQSFTTYYTEVETKLPRPWWLGSVNNPNLKSGAGAGLTMTQRGVQVGSSAGEKGLGAQLGFVAGGDGSSTGSDSGGLWKGPGGNSGSGSGGGGGAGGAGGGTGGGTGGGAGGGDHGAPGSGGDGGSGSNDGGSTGGDTGGSQDGGGCDCCLPEQTDLTCLLYCKEKPPPAGACDDKNEDNGGNSGNCKNECCGDTSPSLKCAPLCASIMCNGGGDRSGGGNDGKGGGGNNDGGNNGGGQGGGGQGGGNGDGGFPCHTCSTGSSVNKRQNSENNKSGVADQKSRKKNKKKNKKEKKQQKPRRLTPSSSPV